MIGKDKGKANRREEVIVETRRDGECQLPRGHKIQLVSGGGKWQNWMDKLKRTSLIPGNPVILSIPASKGRATRTTTGRAWLLGGFSGSLEPQDACCFSQK